VTPQCLKFLAACADQLSVRSASFLSLFTREKLLADEERNSASLWVLFLFLAMDADG
jgi:hypothetical protein